MIWLTVLIYSTDVVLAVWISSEIRAIVVTLRWANKNNHNIQQI